LSNEEASQTSRSGRVVAPSALINDTVERSPFGPSPYGSQSDTGNSSTPASGNRFDSALSSPNEAPRTHGTQMLQSQGDMQQGLFLCNKDHCNKSFTRESSLRRHQAARHSPTKVVFCDVDGCEGARIGFRRKEYLSKHMRRFHSESS
jgi:hypothetical protein